MDIVQKKDVRPFTMLHIDFLDCETAQFQRKNFACYSECAIAIMEKIVHQQHSLVLPDLPKKTGLAEKDCPNYTAIIRRKAINF